MLEELAKAMRAAMLVDEGGLAADRPWEELSLDARGRYLAGVHAVLESLGQGEMEVSEDITRAISAAVTAYRMCKDVKMPLEYVAGVMGLAFHGQLAVCAREEEILFALKGAKVA